MLIGTAIGKGRIRDAERKILLEAQRLVINIGRRIEAVISAAKRICMISPVIPAYKVRTSP